MGPYCQHCADDGDTSSFGECLGHHAECSGRSDGRGALDVITESVMRAPDGRFAAPLNFHRTPIFPTP